LVLNSVTSIGYESFEYCDRLTSIEGFRNVKTVSSYAFNNIGSHNSVTFDDFSGLRNIGNYAFKDVHFSGGITLSDCDNIGDAAFKSCYVGGKMELIGCKKVGNQIFDNTTINNNNLVIDFKSLVNIGEYAFFNLPSVYSTFNTVSLDNVSSIGACAFEFNGNVESLTIGNNNYYSVTVDVSAFASCDSLTSVTFDVRTIDGGENMFVSCQNLKYINIRSNSFTSSYYFDIPSYAFYNCSKLVNINGDTYLVKSKSWKKI
jgi:hypothetical protein